MPRFDPGVGAHVAVGFGSRNWVAIGPVSRQYAVGVRSRTGKFARRVWEGFASYDQSEVRQSMAPFVALTEFGEARCTMGTNSYVERT